MTFPSVFISSNTTVNHRNCCFVQLNEPSFVQFWRAIFCWHSGWIAHNNYNFLLWQILFRSCFFTLFIFFAIEIRSNNFSYGKTCCFHIHFENNSLIKAFFVLWKFRKSSKKKCMVALRYQARNWKQSV